jgi:transcriptional regulator with XRE-family HTH domain
MSRGLMVLQSYDMKAITRWREVKMQSNERKPITGSQLRAARALLRWSADDLAEKSMIGVATIRRAESREGPLGVTPANESAMRAALESAGVIFVDENGEGPGVRLRKAGGSGKAASISLEDLNAENDE